MNLVSSAEAAARLAVHRRTVIRWAHDGILVPAVHAPGIRGAFMFERDTVEALARSREGRWPA